MIWIALPILLVAAGAAGYALGYRRGSSPRREEERQREIEARLLGRKVQRPASPAEAAVIRRGRIMGTHAWRR